MQSVEDEIVQRRAVLQKQIDLSYLIALKIARILKALKRQVVSFDKGHLGHSDKGWEE